MDMTTPLSMLAMQGVEGFKLVKGDYFAFFGYFLCLMLIGFIAGRKKNECSEDYFLAGRSLPWYVVGSSYIAANISSEQFIGMVGAAYVYGICVATPEWSCVIAFTFLIWLFIPFLMAAKVFTAPEFLEKRFNAWVRNIFAAVTVFMNVIVIMGGVIYGGALALQTLFGVDQLPFLQNIYVATHLDPIWFSILILSIVAGGFAVYGGLRSVAWMDVLTIAIMVAGGLSVTILGWIMLAQDTEGSTLTKVTEGFKVMVQRNQAQEGIWAEAVQKHIPDMMFDASPQTEYNRLSVVQPINHKFFPWIHWVFSFFYIGLWYLVINQFMVQRLFAAKNIYHARMGIIFASYMKLLIPFFVVIPGLILFAYYPDIMNMDNWSEIQPLADKGYVRMLQIAVPAGLRGLFLAALFGAIQSTVSAVLNSTSTIFTMDIYKRMVNKEATENTLVRIGRVSSVFFLLFAMLLAYFLSQSGQGLFYFIQLFYSFFGPPFSAIFLLGTLWRRINGQGAIASIIIGLLFAFGLKLYADLLPGPLEYTPWKYMTTFPIQALSTWMISMVVCIVGSLMTTPPLPEQVSDSLTFNWKKMNVGGELGKHWFSNVAFWWILSMVIMFLFIYIFGIKL